MSKSVDDLKCKMVKNVVQELMDIDDKCTGLIVIADTERGQMVRFGADGATRQDLLALIGILEDIKISILATLNKNRGDGDEGDYDDDIPTNSNYH